MVFKYLILVVQQIYRVVATTNCPAWGAVGTAGSGAAQLDAVYMKLANSADSPVSSPATDYDIACKADGALPYIKPSTFLTGGQSKKVFCDTNDGFWKLRLNSAITLFSNAG